ncbi:hypothetical protein DPMN_108040 [Dreissena polymorpha]|uniref:Uncharacterized protein n=1 Tax=Dreissena polymorpha TaxID=45954 RepID=A0A9D4QLL5_DREPO|nr:hypothetical protein DPMN_108040 [Dreissena polymorpha]
MRDDDTEILFQSGLVCASESNSSTGRDVHSFKNCPSSSSSDGLDVDFPVACSGKQSCTESRTW